MDEYHSASKVDEKISSSVCGSSRPSLHSLMDFWIEIPRAIRAKDRSGGLRVPPPSKKLDGNKGKSSMADPMILTHRQWGLLQRPRKYRHPWRICVSVGSISFKTGLVDHEQSHVTQDLISSRLFLYLIIFIPTLRRESMKECIAITACIFRKL